MPAQTIAPLTLEPAPDARYSFSGLIGERLRVNVDAWLLPAPHANPAMLEIFRDRDRQPRRDLVPWAGEFVGKYLTSAVLAYRLDPDERLRHEIAGVVEELIEAQDEDGYLGPWPRMERYTGVTAGGEHALWDLWGHYHCMRGLLMWHRETGDDAALDACLRAADAICDRFLEGGTSVLAAGAEEMNMSVAHLMGLLYLKTHEPRYLAMLRQIESAWEDPRAGDYVRQALAGVPFWQMPKPRWESLHDVQAILALYRITGEERYRAAFEGIWRSIVAGDRHNTGGFSSGEKATGNPYDPGAIETCCTVAWMVLSVDMLRLTGDSRIADELELSTLNATLGAQHPSGRWWTYNTPMDGVRRASAHDIVFQAREGSPELNCCSVNGPRSLGLLADWALMTGSDGVTLNYYGPSVFQTTLSGGARLAIEQTTDYPLDGHVVLFLALDEPAHFTLRLRVPEWSRCTTVLVPGDEGGALAHVTPGQYLELKREWRDGDAIHLGLDLRLRTWVGEREAAGKVCLYRGPLLLAWDRRYNVMDPGDVGPPKLDEEPTPVAYRGPGPAPWGLWEIPTHGGPPLRLCDFSSAGSTGTPYLTWLPLQA